MSVLYQEKIKIIEKDFQNFILANPVLKKNLEETYYRKYNSSLKPAYNGNFLKFKELAITPMKHQLDATAMLLENNGGIIDHKVGYGKSITMALTAMKFVELGISKKNLLLCLKANITDLEKNVLMAFPNAKVLVADERNFNAKKRQIFFQNIVNNSWDIVIMTHENYNKISQSLDIQKQVLSEELDNLEKDLEILKVQGIKIDKRLRKGLLIRKENLTANLNYLNDLINSKKDNTIRFDQMGFGHIFVDESQKFKNLSYTTRHSRVGGLNTQQGSQMASNLLLGIRTLQKHYGADKGITFASGTPLSNSITELYVLFKYLSPNMLKYQDIQSFDQWAHVFAMKDIQVEPGMTGKYILKERFRKFKNVPELSNLFSKITHSVHQDIGEIDKPEKITHFINLEPSETQLEYFEKVKLFAKHKDPSYLSDSITYSDNQLNAIGLLAMNYLTKASLDLKLIDEHEYNNHPSFKIIKCAELIKNHYDKSEEYKGTQLVFIDQSIPKAEYNLYDSLRKHLTKIHGIPSEQIAYVHQADSKKQRSLLFNAVNKGEVRILIGSSKKLGTGVNVQERAIAMYHLDIPYLPSEIDQREGRVIRKGNIYAKQENENKVDVYVFATNKSIDSKRFNILSTKATFISQIRNIEKTTRVIDEGPIDSEGKMSYADFVALTSDNSDFGKIEKLKNELENLNTKKFINLQQYNENTVKTKYYNDLLSKDKKVYDKIAADKTYYKNNESIFEGVPDIKLFKFTKDLINHQTSKLSDIGEIIKKGVLHAAEKQQYDTDLLFYDKLSLRIKYGENNTYKMFVYSPSGLSYGYGLGQVVKDNIKTSEYFKNAFSKVISLEKIYNQKIEDHNNRLQALKNNKIEIDNNLDQKISEIKKEISFLESQILEDQKKQEKQESISNSDLKNDKVKSNKSSLKI